MFGGLGDVSLIDLSLPNTFFKSLLGLVCISLGILLLQTYVSR